ncbi:MAG: molecular chaperone TorD family protein [Bacteroidota bacterium]
MNTLTVCYDTFSRMFSYPDYRYREILKESHEVLNTFFIKKERKQSGSAETKVQVELFFQQVQKFSDTDFEELYTRTFDINPVANLELGWHLYGETYERGTFLVMMRDFLRRCNIEESTELPDHLTHVLLVLGRMEKEEADFLAEKYVLPSLIKISESFKEKETENPYQHLLLALQHFIEQHHLTGVEIYG